jgi:hypothetical protein
MPRNSGRLPRNSRLVLRNLSLVPRDCLTHYLYHSCDATDYRLVEVRYRLEPTPV